jgi:hypothetical protein
MKHRTIILVAMYVWLALFVAFEPARCLAEGFQGEDDFSPWNFIAALPPSREGRAELSWSATLLKKSLIIFSTYISAVDGDRCNMYPTCSAYGREAVEKHGFIKGLILTVDRLIHESNEIDTAPRIIRGDRFRYLDPVSNNDFWWQPHP